MKKKKKERKLNNFFYRAFFKAKKGESQNMNSGYKNMRPKHKFEVV